MLEKDIYDRRFRQQMEKKGMTATEAEIEKASNEMRSKGIPPSIAVTKVFTDMYYKRVEAEQQFPIVLKATCDSFGIAFDEADSSDLTDIRSIAAWIAVNRLDLRPHTVIKEHLGLSSNSMVNHSVYRADKRMDKSVMFAEKLNQVLANLNQPTIQDEGQR